MTLPSASVQPRSVVLLVRALEGPRSSLRQKGAGDRRRSCGRRSAPNRRPREQTALRCDKALFPDHPTMSKDMTDQQQRVVTSHDDGKRCPSDQEQTAEEHWVQDALEDDEVREALKCLHARGKNHGDRLVSLQRPVIWPLLASPLPRGDPDPKLGSQAPKRQHRRRYFPPAFSQALSLVRPYGEPRGIARRLRSWPALSSPLDIAPWQMAPSLAEYAYRGIGPLSVVLFYGVGPW